MFVESSVDVRYVGSDMSVVGRTFTSVMTVINMISGYSVVQARYSLLLRNVL